MMNYGLSLKRLDRTRGYLQVYARDQYIVIEPVYACLLFELVQLEVVFFYSYLHLKVEPYRLQLLHMHNKNHNLL